MSVLWLTGAPGVGKSTAGWALYTLAKAEDLPVAYLDIDQLGLLLPAPPGDPDYHRVKAANLHAVLDTFRRHGAQHVIVSGVVDSERGIEPYLRDATDEFTVIRLWCTREELRRRYLERGSSIERLDELMALVDTLDRNAVGTTLDTTTLSPAAIAAALADRIRSSGPVQSVRPGTSPAEAPAEPAPVLLLAGPTAVGKSTVGWEILQLLRERGILAAFVDVDQFGFFRSNSVQLKAENLQRVWRGYRDAGARALIVVARGAPQAYAEALAAELVTTAYLEASPSELAERIAQRGLGLGHGLAGDSLAGASAGQQARTLERSGAEVGELRLAQGGALVINTDQETSSAIAAKLAEVFRSDSA